MNKLAKRNSELGIPPKAKSQCSISHDILSLVFSSSWSSLAWNC